MSMYVKRFLLFYERGAYKCGILLLFIHINKPIVDNDAPVVWPVGTPGARLTGFIKEITNLIIATHKIKAYGLMVSEKFFFMFFLL